MSLHKDAGGDGEHDRPGVLVSFCSIFPMLPLSQRHCCRAAVPRSAPLRRAFAAVRSDGEIIRRQRTEVAHQYARQVGFSLQLLLLLLFPPLSPMPTCCSLIQKKGGDPVLPVSTVPGKTEHRSLLQLLRANT